ncbi:IS3 family transposase [Corynebacterium variabile]|uniref:IS3 family transposase n=1 Tax=Corynebacterium variabile TaxID=1727 RepID=UPI0028AA05DF|nr:IS3 family transposase [Corynebacterium variabile]
MKARAVFDLRDDHRLPVLLAVSGLAASTYHYWRVRFQAHGPAAPDRRVDAIRAVLIQRRKRHYGWRRVRAELQVSGMFLSGKTVNRLMRQHDLQSPIRAKRFNSYRGDDAAAHPAAPNIVARNFDRDQPNRLWLTDVTEFALDGPDPRRVYLSAIKDTFNGEIIAWTTSTSPTVGFVTDMMKEAIGRNVLPADLILHSDQGFQYRHRKFVNLLAQAGVTQSMSRKGTCLDNSPMESFFGHMKDDMFRFESFTDPDSLIAEIDDYIGFYNHRRSQQRLDYLSPVAYRIRETAYLRNGGQMLYGLAG